MNHAKLTLLRREISKGSPDGNETKIALKGLATGGNRQATQN